MGEKAEPNFEKESGREHFDELSSASGEEMGAELNKLVEKDRMKAWEKE